MQERDQAESRGGKERQARGPKQDVIEKEREDEGKRREERAKDEV